MKNDDTSIPNIPAMQGGVFNIKDEADSLWEDVTITKEMRGALGELEDMSSKQLEHSLRKIDIDQTKLKDDLRTANEVENPDVLQEIFLELSTKAFKSGMHIDGMNPIMRAMQGYSSNMVSRNIKGEPYSRLFVVALDNLPKQHNLDINNMPPKLLNAHKYLDIHIDFLINAKDIKSNKKEICQHIRRFEECRSIGHHALDWYIQTLPEDLFKKPKEKIAAIVLDIVSRFNEKAPSARWIPFHREELAELSKRKTNIGNAGLRVFREVRNNITDPDLMILPADPQYNEVSLEPPVGHTSEDGNTESVVIGTHPDQLDPRELPLRMSILFDRYNISDKINVEEIKKWVYESMGDPGNSGREFQTKFIELFPKPSLVQKEAFLEVLGTAVDAWNAFPHKALSGKSPLEMMTDAKNKDAN